MQIRGNILYNTETEENSGGGSVGLPIVGGGVTTADRAATLSKGKIVAGADENRADALAPDNDGSNDSVDMTDIFADEAISGKPDTRPGKSQKPVSRNNLQTAKPVRRQQLDDNGQPIKSAQQQSTTTNDSTTTNEAENILDDSAEVDAGDDLQETTQEGDDDNASTEADKGVKRDYSGLSDETVNYLKKLPNGIYKHVRPLVDNIVKMESDYLQTRDELAKIKKDPNRIPDSWYENENAYQLAPEYQKISERYNALQYEAGYWEHQLTLIAEGKPWNLLTKDANGNYVAGQQQEPNAVASSKIQATLNRILVEQQGAEQQAQQIKASFGKTIAEANAHYSRFDPYFERLRPELQPKKDAIDAYIKALHPSDQKSRTAQLGAKMFSLILNQAELINKLEQQMKREKTTAQDAIAAGPKTRQKAVPVGGKQKTNAKGVVDFDELEAEMRG